MCILNRASATWQRPSTQFQTSCSATVAGTALQMGGCACPNFPPFCNASALPNKSGCARSFSSHICANCDILSCCYKKTQVLIFVHFLQTGVAAPPPIPAAILYLLPAARSRGFSEATNAVICCPSCVAASTGLANLTQTYARSKHISLC